MEQAVPQTASRYEIATVAGGCFWCLEAVYDQMQGVVSVESGYIGGQVDAPTYEAVCSGTTGHAEAVRINFDPAIVSHRELLEVLFVIHDPTTLNRQGHDSGTQYRSAIFFHTPEQQQMAEDVIAAITKERLYPDPIVTQVVPAGIWYEAEPYHQEYFMRHPFEGYCTAVVLPKVIKFRKLFTAKLKP
ncbi:MAG: peptide-methionine (S)-S-oxide reductase MsrA [Nitrospiraceae bacterium]|nr:peptide-methionine (S)-S-oxide reductase MsrA [Nitrospira sp.]MDW7648770.1 peptide-methionine (S)-S-oxide reductase MsrA [Nitrospiraceae bacterium]MBP0122286.1 peptide-methionine (S)-S-oxide reductase MsrA [Nitrospira sp.]MBP0124093.1 peptide-methionine (S)-S-oxide reductase MsrA [Nitrospira sp.]MBP0127193.1 peptide-methionine (S)-S-oxide reductase MsrA [Nitrospira sp.]